MHVAMHLERPTREPRGPRVCSPIWSCSGWGLPCHACYQPRGALLPHHFTLTCAMQRWPSAVCFLRHFPSAHAAQGLPGTLPSGARTFLRNTAAAARPTSQASGYHCPVTCALCLGAIGRRANSRTRRSIALPAERQPERSAPPPAAGSTAPRRPVCSAWPAWRAPGQP